MGKGLQVAAASARGTAGPVKGPFSGHFSKLPLRGFTALDGAGTALALLMHHSTVKEASRWTLYL